jgi:hypothetical protein
MADPKRPQRELFPTTKDWLTAGRVVKRVLGSEFFTSYTALPKSVGAKGDEGVRGSTVLISTTDEEANRQLITDALEKDQEYRQYLQDVHDSPATGYKHFEDAALDIVMREIGNKTTATKVLLDITPGGGRFQPEP